MEERDEVLNIGAINYATFTPHKLVTTFGLFCTSVLIAGFIIQFLIPQNTYHKIFDHSIFMLYIQGSIIPLLLGAGGIFPLVALLFKKIFSISVSDAKIYFGILLGLGICLFIPLQMGLSFANYKCLKDCIPQSTIATTSILYGISWIALPLLILMKLPKPLPKKTINEDPV